MRAYELLSHKTKWTKGSLARDTNNHPVILNSISACKWCAIGAIFTCYPHPHYKGPLAKLEEYVGMFPEVWNDSTTYEEVIKVLRELDI